MMMIMMMMMNDDDGHGDEGYGDVDDDVDGQ